MCRPSFLLSQRLVRKRTWTPCFRSTRVTPSQDFARGYKTWGRYNSVHVPAVSNYCCTQTDGCCLCLIILPEVSYFPVCSAFQRHPLTALLGPPACEGRRQLLLPLVPIRVPGAVAAGHQERRRRQHQGHAGAQPAAAGGTRQVRACMLAAFWCCCRCLVCRGTSCCPSVRHDMTFSWRSSSLFGARCGMGNLVALVALP